jgi:hypothetical protein
MRPKLAISDRLSETIAVKFTLDELARINAFTEAKYPARTKMVRAVVLAAVEKWEKRN